MIAGIGLSVVGMVAAALGNLSPIQGALIQEAIDVAVILNALRALHIESSGADTVPLITGLRQEGARA